MKSESTSWNKAGVWICTKCFKGTNVAENLKMEWKVKLKEMGLGSEVRVMTSSCLDTCPPDEQAILMIDKKGNQEVIVCNPKKESDEVFSKILKTAKS